MASNDMEYLDAAIKQATDMLTKKRDIWTAGQGVFQNFEIHDDFGVEDVQMGLLMCNLKMNRIKSCWKKASISEFPHLEFNGGTDSQDSVLDLACYALLTLAMMKRESDMGILP
jgi:hypothetical protein